MAFLFPRRTSYCQLKYVHTFRPNLRYRHRVRVLSTYRLLHHPSTIIRNSTCVSFYKQNLFFVRLRNAVYLWRLVMIGGCEYSQVLIFLKRMWEGYEIQPAHRPLINTRRDSQAVMQDISHPGMIHFVSLSLSSHTPPFEIFFRYYFFIFMRRRGWPLFQKDAILGQWRTPARSNARSARVGRGLSVLMHHYKTRFWS